MKMLTIHHYPGAGADYFCWGVEGGIAIPPAVWHITRHKARRDERTGR